VTPAIRALKEAGVPHEIHTYDHDPAAASFGDEVVEALGVDPGEVFKTLVARLDQTAFAMAIVPVSSRLDLKALARAQGAKRAVLADAADAERATGYVVGGISPLGQRKQIPAWIDESALDLDRIYVSAGQRGLQVSLSPADLVKMVEAGTAALTS
jgi:Cys-tRNA(Pro)/Cys-tRNA(Cys) deacylase